MNLSVTSPHSHAVSLAGASADSCFEEEAASSFSYIQGTAQALGSWIRSKAEPFGCP